MNAPVSLATVHHQGAGAPHDAPGDAANGGYTLWIGVRTYQILRAVWVSYATLHYNHTSLDVCFSGDRDNYPITPRDLELLRAGVRDCRAQGFIIDAPYVRPHRESPGSVTICPGNECAYPDPPRFPFGDALTWLAVVTAIHEEAPPMPPKVAPEFFPALEIVSACQFATHAGVEGFAMLDASGAVFCDPPSSYQGGANGKAYFAGRTAAKIDPAPAGYTITATSGEKYAYPEH